MVQAGPPSGPRGRVGASAEDAAVAYLASAGWSILARNVRVGRDELDIVASEGADPGCLVFVEVRSGSTRAFGSPHESVDARKVARLYRAGLTLWKGSYSGGARPARWLRWRVDLITLVQAAGSWRVEVHLRGLEPP